MRNRLNIPALKLADHVGIRKVIATAHRFGVTTDIPAFLPIALGAAEISLYEQVAAYSSFPNDGIRLTPHFVHRVTTADGEVLWDDTPDVHVSTDVKTAREMMQLFEAVTHQGTGATVSQLQHPLGGKTGTTNDFTDAWFLGFSPSVTCGVWVGYDDRQSLGDKETGARVALPIWMTLCRQQSPAIQTKHFPAKPRWRRLSRLRQSLPARRQQANPRRSISAQSVTMKTDRSMTMGVLWSRYSNERIVE